MNKGIQEEIIAALWAIASILCFGFGFNLLGWFLAAMSIFDIGCAFKEVVKELKLERDMEDLL